MAACAASAVSATMRRMPLLTDSSAVMTNSPISPVFRKCVPPQNSMEKFRQSGSAGFSSKSVTGALDRDHADHRRILFAKDAASRRPLILRDLLLRSFHRENPEILRDSLSNQIFDPLDFFLRHGFAMREIEAEFFRIDERALLLDAVSPRTSRRAQLARWVRSVVLLGLAPGGAHRQRLRPCRRLAMNRQPSDPNAGRIRQRLGLSARGSWRRLAGLTAIPDLPAPISE